jgi:hypothetical protein
MTWENGDGEVTIDIQFINIHHIMYTMNPNHIINNFININKQYPVTVIYLAGEIGKETEGTAMAERLWNPQLYALTEELQNQCRGRERDLTLFAGRRNCKCLESP